MARQTAREVDLEAAEWVAKADLGPLDATTQARLDAWLAADVRHPGAYARMMAVSVHCERAEALGADYDPARFAAEPASSPSVMARPSRRGAMLGLGAAAAGLAGVGVWGLTRPQVFSTRKGEIRQLALKDGSVMTLDTDSKVAVRYSGGLRHLQLLAGQAFFDVTRDPARPFVVAAGATRVTVLGTSFSVSRIADRPIQVLVSEGVVEVSRAGAAKVSPVRLLANDKAVEAARDGAGAQALNGPAMTVASMPADDLHRQLAWRSGSLSFEGQTLADAVAEFNRYNDTRILVDDAALARQEVAGFYLANDPVGFANAMATSLGAHVRVGDGEVRIAR